MIQWHTQAGNITTNIMVKIYFTLPEISATEIVTWSCHVDDSAKSRYDMILCRYLRKYLGLNLELSEHTIEAYDGNSKGSSTPMIDLGTYEFKI